MCFLSKFYVLIVGVFVLSLIGVVLAFTLTFSHYVNAHIFFLVTVVSKLDHFLNQI